MNKSQIATKLLSILSKREGRNLDELVSSGIISVGNVSYTNMSLKRSFNNNKKGEEEVRYEHSAKIVIDKSLNILDASLDLVHELTHYLYRKRINPYEMDLNNKDGLKEFIISNIEGPGGEVDAYLVECKFLSELNELNLNAKFAISNRNCKMLFSSYGPQADGKAKNLRNDLIKEFYKIGDNYKFFLKEIKRFSLKEEDFPYLSENLGNVFISSLYDANYPLALLLEYQEIIKKICNQDLKRIERWRLESGTSTASTASTASSSAASTSSILSISTATTVKQFIHQLEKNYQLKCSTFIVSQALDI
ncbi:MAG: hypothetical protein HQK51_19050 [Oligoflexia bacterium]|nr:hypothetical protein [Oligoflexia bacterium]